MLAAVAASVDYLSNNRRRMITQQMSGEPVQFTDYAAVSFGPQAGRPIHLLGDGATTVQFRDYAYIRVTRGGAVTVRGDLTGLRLPGVRGPITVNGTRVDANQQAGALVYLPAMLSPWQKTQLR